MVLMLESPYNLYFHIVNNLGYFSALFKNFLGNLNAFDHKLLKEKVFKILGHPFGLGFQHDSVHLSTYPVPR